MKALSRLVKVMGMAISVGIALPVFAESAPVYDVDNLPAQFDGASDQGQELPPPPPVQEETFVPMQQQSQQQPVVNDAPASSHHAASANLSMDQRVGRVEQQIGSLQTNTLRVESLQNEVQSLRGQVEELTHQLQQLQNQQKTMYSDLDKRLSTSSAGKDSMNLALAAGTGTISPDMGEPAAPVKPAKAPAKTAVKTESKSADTIKSASLAAQPNVAEEQDIYQKAYNLIKAKKYNDAVDVLQGMLKKYPSGQFASNAHYWLGELYGLMGKNDQALTEFNAVVKNYPTSPRVPDAQLKVGLILAAQSKWSDAKAALKKVINRYPGTSPARLASEQLKQIKQAGH